METKTRKITRLAIIAGLYAALTIVFHLFLMVKYK